MKISTVEQWRESFHDQETARATENGKYPHRGSQTITAMRHDAIKQICDLAIYGLRIKRSTGKKADAVAAEKLRQIADQLSPIEPTQGTE